MPVPRLDPSGWVEVMRARAATCKEIDGSVFSYPVAVLMCDAYLPLVASLCGMSTVDSNPELDEKVKRQ